MEALYPRIYVPILQDLLFQGTEMLFLMGPRQVGKTTITKIISRSFEQSLYVNYDVDEHRRWIVSGQNFIERIFPPIKTHAKPLVIFDEIHKYPNWKNFLKGFYDLYSDFYRVMVTGSAQLNIYQKGGDSLMGRYLPYTIFPFSVGERNPNSLNNLLRKPEWIPDFDALYDFGGFPTPFHQRNVQSYNRWKNRRQRQLFQEDILSLTHIQEIGQMELCAQILEEQIGGILNRASLAEKIHVSTPTISRWMEAFKQFYYLFYLPPYFQNIPHSLIKQPKPYLWDWSLVSEPGAKFENFVASHLYKSISLWSEHGYGTFDLYFLRDKNQREVDFVVTRDHKPWFLVEAKNSLQPISKSLLYYQEQTKAPFAFQVIKNAEYTHLDCFADPGVWNVPARTFLSQLV